MKIVLQRVNYANVVVREEEVAHINKGYLLLVGVAEGDTETDADYLAKKISQLRVFEDNEGKMNLSIKEVAGSILSVSQFTLLANTKKGNRPSFTGSAAPDEANRLYQYFNTTLRAYDLDVSEGIFGEHMTIGLENDGPVTIVFDTNDR